MKKLLLAVCVFFTEIPAGQGQSLIRGTVTSAEAGFDPFSYSGIMVDEYRHDKLVSTSAIAVDKQGNFKRSFSKGREIRLHTSYENYYNADTLLIANTDTLTVHFRIRPRVYRYTQASATADFHNQLRQIITHDSAVFNWNRQYHFTAPYHFEYLFLPVQSDREFEKQEDLYNVQMQEHLDTLNGPGWAFNIALFLDSMTNLDADNYGKKNRIDFSSLRFPPTGALTGTMQKAVDEKTLEYKRLFSSQGHQIRDTSVSFMLDKIDHDPDYRYIFEAEYCMAFHYREMIPELIKRLSNSTYTGLTNTADLIIWERIQSGHLTFWGHGSIAMDDLFTVAGRANHLLCSITGENFGHVYMKSTPADLARLQNRWAYWLLQLDKK